MRSDYHPRLLIATDLPPVREGPWRASCIVVYRLFEGYPKDRTRYVTLDTRREDFIPPVDVAMRLDRLFAFSEAEARCPDATLGINVLCDWWRSMALGRLCRRHGVEQVFACPFRYGHLVRASVMTCCRLGIPLVLYFLDDWAEWYRVNAPAFAAAAERWQTRAIHVASKIYTNGPGMQRVFSEKYGVDSSILTNVVDTSYLGVEPRDSSSEGGNPATIVYAGSIYGAQHDSLSRLVEALRLLKRRSEVSCVLDLYTDLLDPDALQRWGWDDGLVRLRSSFGYAELPQVLAGAEILFLPLSFEREWSYTVTTAAPGKLPEYAASGRPLLVHAPPYADIVQLCRERDFGVVVDTPDVARLADEIVRILKDREYARERGQRSAKVAAKYYDQGMVRDGLYRDLQGLNKRNSTTDPSSSFCSRKFWQDSYAVGKTSGPGSYGRLAEFKAEIVNAFIREERVESVIELGCGDGNQLSLLECPRYTGLDVAEDAVQRCRGRFAGDESKRFGLYRAGFAVGLVAEDSADLALSLDVIFHLVEDDVYECYMNDLFTCARKFVMIYSSDKIERCDAPHVLHRKFTEWVIAHQPQWKLVRKIPNKYPFVSDGQSESFCDFYIYRKDSVGADSFT